MAYTPIHRSIRREIGQAARCGTAKKGQAKVRTAEYVGHGFLTHRFLPLRGENSLPYSKEGEAFLLSSFQNLAMLYGYEPMDVSGEVFPLNLSGLYRQATERLAQKDKWVELLLVEDRGRIRLATTKSASTGSTLFFLPVYPLWKWMHGKKRRQEVNLLLSVFAYLHNLVGIPFFNGWTYTGSRYHNLLEWLTEDDGWTDYEEYEACLSSVKAAIYFGDRLHKIVKHPYHLHAWGDRLGQLPISCEQSLSIHNVAEQLYRLYRDYPTRSLADNIQPELLRPNEEYRMTMEQVFSFIWDERGWLGQNLVEMVCTELNECCAADEPMTIQYFDKPQSEAMHDLDFETRLYGLLHELSDVLRMML